MKKSCVLLIVLFPVFVFANTISGFVKDNKGNLLPFSSVLIKGTTKGTTANSKGKYSLQVDAGSYILICQHVGFKTVERKISITNKDVELDFELIEQQYD